MTKTTRKSENEPIDVLASADWIKEVTASRDFGDQGEKRAGLKPAGSEWGDALLISNLMRMGLSRAEARRHISVSRGYGG